jgi:alpha,alpha-trehalose phosphorylase
MSNIRLADGDYDAVLFDASRGGTWMALINGVAGMRDHDGRLSFHPALDLPVKGKRFTLTIRGRKLRVEIDRETRSATYLLASGGELEITQCGSAVKLAEATPVKLEIVEREGVGGAKTREPRN